MHNERLGRRLNAPARWALVPLIVVASLVSFGSISAHFPTPNYNKGVGISDDGTLVIERSGWPTYISADGGSTWQPLGSRSDYPDGIRWGEDVVETPHGTYIVEETRPYLGVLGITRIAGAGQRALVYPPLHLLKDMGDIRFIDRQLREAWAREGVRAPWDFTRALLPPSNLVYHAPSDNIVAILGLEGVVIGNYSDDSHGRWRSLQTEFGDRAVDVSFPAKMAFVLGELWPVATVIAITATAAAFAFAGWFRVGQPRQARAFILSLVRYLVPFGILLAIYLAMRWLWYAPTPVLVVNGTISLLGAVVVWKQTWPLAGMLRTLVSPLVPLIVAADIWGLAGPWRGDDTVSILASVVSLAGAMVIWRKKPVLVGRGSLLLGSIVAAAGLTVVHTIGAPMGSVLADVAITIGPDAPGAFLFDPWFGVQSTKIDALWIVTLVGLPCSLVALLTFMPFSVRQTLVALSALLGMIGLITLAFAIGIAQGFYLEAAKLYALMLLFPAVCGLGWYLLRSPEQV